MAVNIIRKQSGQANEVTDAMRAAAQNYKGRMSYGDVYRVMEAARIAESGEIERIEISTPSGARFTLYPYNAGESVDPIPSLFDCLIPLICDPDNLIPLAEALLELGKQMKGEV